MQGKSLAKSLAERSKFVIVAELAAGPAFNFAPIEKFLKAAKEAPADSIPQGFDFVGATAPQSPGGVANIEPAEVLRRVKAADLLGPLDFIPHVSCKDHNSDAITASLVSFRAQGIESVLALTGDKPIRSQGVFEVESVGLLQLIQRMNDAAYLKASPGQWNSVTQFFPLAAVSPFKYSEASQMQQYYKMEKKIAAGAKGLITQLGYDWRKSLELMQYLGENHIDIPVLGNVYLLTTLTPAPRLMHDGKLPGCFVSDELLARLQKEKIDDHVERAAQQVAMYKAIGAAGADVGGLLDFETFLKILRRAEQIGADWEKYKDNLCWPGADRFYLYDEAGRRTSPGKRTKRLAQRWFNLTHRLMLDPEHTGFKAGRGLMRVVGAGKGKGFAYRSFATMEKAIKYVAFECQDCGDCYLPENFGCCTMGGDSTIDGRCGNNVERICIGEKIYDAAVAERDGVQRLRETINQPRRPELQHTSSILNYWFARDHTKKSPLISIGDQLSASNPKTAKVMKEILDLGDAGFQRLPGPIGYVKALIQSQADDGADYIAVNVDALSDEEGQLAVKMMKPYVRLVRQWGRGVPVCIDSRFDDALIAGLNEWYNANQPVKTPLLSSIRAKTADRLMALKKEHDFSFVALLGDPASGVSGADDACNAAKQLFEKAVNQHGFGPGRIFFDPVAVPLVKDEPTLAGGRGHTHTAFETMRRLRTDPTTKRSHCLLRIDAAAGELPGRAIGVCRAYAARAIERGMDAGFVNPALHFGDEPADAGLLELVDAFVRMDGSPERTRVAKEMMAKFCAENQKPRKPAPAPALSKS
jgi:5,10-methylenetetrahydrofolate reductase